MVNGVPQTAEIYSRCLEGSVFEDDAECCRLKEVFKLDLPVYLYCCVKNTNTSVCSFHFRG